MTTDESIMKEMLDRATNPAKETPDEMGVQMFCIVVRGNGHLVHKAQEMIVGKVRSSNVTEATRAIALLEECMTHCGGDFQDEAAKFRFLNELIRLVSKKYSGAETPHEVKQRIMECLLLWTTEFPQRQKIRDAYDMLRKEGDIEHSQTAAAVAKHESVLGKIDEAMFAKLIKSNDPENFKRANLLLQHRMAQEARHNDLLLQHRCVLQQVEETVQLLNEMLNAYDASNDDVNETIHELYRSCKKHKPILQHLPKLLGSDESDSRLMADTIDANTNLLAVIARCQQLVAPSPAKTINAAAVTATPTATTATTAASASSSQNTILLNELIGDLLFSTNEADNEQASTTLADSGAVAATNSTTSNASASGDMLADLSEIFSSALAESEAKQQQQQQQSQDPVAHVELLEPQVLGQQSAATSAGEHLSNGNAVSTGKMSGGVREMPEIDMLSNELFCHILPMQERKSTFHREPQKQTLNELKRERMQIKSAVAPQPEQQPPAVSTPVELFDDEPLLDGKPNETASETAIAAAAAAASVAVAAPAIKHLSEISIDLEDVTASGEQRVVLDDDEMQLSLNFTEDRPSRHVSVLVISAQNKSREAVKEFHFEASAKKPCKVRLLPATDTAMPPHKPFRPATPINQIMLLLNPTGKPVDVTCIVGYKLGTDPDPIKESIVAQGIPFVE